MGQCQLQDGVDILTPNFSSAAQTLTPQKGMPWGSLLPVDQGPPGILGVQEGLRGQPPPVEDRGTEVMRSAKFEPGWLLAHS